mgnify:CR=1 FL=1
MTETARMYGGSLYDLAAEEGLEARILGELDEAVALFKANPDYLHLLSTPSIPKRERCGLLDEALRDQVHLYVLNFLKILCEKGTLRELSGCARAYRVRYNQAHGILEATATTAVAMTEQQAKSLHEKLEKLTGKTIDLKTKVDPKVLGGIREILTAPIVLNNVTSDVELKMPLQIPDQVLADQHSVIVEITLQKGTEKQDGSKADGNQNQ